MPRYKARGFAGGAARGVPGTGGGPGPGPGALPQAGEAVPGGGSRAGGADGVLREELGRLLAAGTWGPDGGSDPGAGPGAGAAPDVMDACDVLDVLWIARLSGLTAEDRSPVSSVSPASLMGPGQDSTTAAAPLPSASPASPGSSTAPTSPNPERTPASGREGVAPQLPAARLHLPGGPRGVPSAPGGAYAIRVAQPAALPDVLSLTRALRPLRQTVPSAHVRTLDVPATAAASGDTGLLLPVLRPATERRFSVDLLVDVGTTMTVWHRLAGELRTLLERHGTFADVRAWALHTDGPEPRLAPFRRGPQAPAPTRRWGEVLYDPTGRRVVLVLTDGVGPSWYGAELPRMLARWSGQRPVAALQVLPSRLWHRTALRTAVVRARGAAAPRATIEAVSSAPLPGIARGRAGTADRARVDWLPVLEVSEPWLSPWARLVSGRTSDWTPLRAAALTVVDRPARATPADEPDTPAGWIERFEVGYSPDAFRLLRLLSAAPLSLPVMRLVQRALLPASTPMHLAELFLSGLLVRRTPVEPGEDPDSVVYDFRDGVRDALLARMTRTESRRVLRQVTDGVSERVAATLGGVTDFAALMAAAENGAGAAVLDGLELPEDSRAFAEVALAVIGGAGGDYQWLVDRLAGGVAAVGSTGAAGAEAEAETRSDTGAETETETEAETDTEADEYEERGTVGARLAVRLGRGLGRFSGRRRGVRPAEAGAGDGPEHARAEVPALPWAGPAPASYIPPAEAADVLAVLRRGAPSTGVSYPVDSVAECVIEGAPGAGKTTLALHCVRELQGSAGFTSVHWIRVGTGADFEADLTALATELGIPDEGDAPARMNGLTRYLREHPGWLLIYDGVTSGFSPHWLPPEGYGSLLVTADTDASWPWPDSMFWRMHERVRMSELSFLDVLNHLHSTLADERGELWVWDDELADLAVVTGRHPRELVLSVAAVKDARRPVHVHVEQVLAKRLEDAGGAGFRDSLVWLARDGVFVGTGVVAWPGAVLTTVIEDLPGAVEVHWQGRSHMPVFRWDRAGGISQLTLLRVPGLMPAHSDLSREDENADLVAAWYAPAESTREAPLIRLRPGSAPVTSLPTGTALIDTAGRPRALTAAPDSDSTDGSAGTIEVTPGLLADLAAGVRARDRMPVAPQPTREAPQPPYFYLSCVHGAGGGGSERRFFRDLTAEISRLTPALVSGTGFFAEEELRGDENRQERTKLALASARVFVPLYSRQYFASQWCGREWDAFSRRRQFASESEGVSTIVPVLWAGTDEWRRPLATRSVPYIDPRFGGRYPAEGLARLMDEGNRSEYWQVVRRIARAVVNAAESTSLSPCDLSLFEDLKNAFDDSGWWD
ncbi:TIR-like protein FxsC [Streptomyces sp. NBC_01390]|uniref:TIR-like protein FxsC n=1 Tax=Streptomyces sp. NBC_01390 TaxID=2903850 RepID=UPI0032514121